MALDVTHCRSEKEKLQWAFRLYDVDDSGSINLKEITAIMETLDQVRKSHATFVRSLNYDLAYPVGFFSHYFYLRRQPAAGQVMG